MKKSDLNPNESASSFLSRHTSGFHRFNALSCGLGGSQQKAGGIAGTGCSHCVKKEIVSIMWFEF